MLQNVIECKLMFKNEDLIDEVITLQIVINQVLLNCFCISEKIYERVQNV